MKDKAPASRHAPESNAAVFGARTRIRMRSQQQFCAYDCSHKSIGLLPILLQACIARDTLPCRAFRYVVRGCTPRPFSIGLSHRTQYRRHWDRQAATEVAQSERFRGALRQVHQVPVPQSALPSQNDFFDHTRAVRAVRARAQLARVARSSLAFALPLG